MRKNIKYSASIIIMILSIVFGYNTQAEEKGDRIPEGNTVRIENKEKREEFKGEVQDIRENLKNEIEGKREEFKKVVELIKENRELFKKEIETKREEAKTKIKSMKATFKENLSKIKDEAKKVSTEKIVNTIELLNTKFTNQFSERIIQMENVLLSIESRINKAETKGIDTTAVKIELEKAKNAIKETREAISLQSSKVYEVNITTESTLKVEMKKVRDLFVSDTKALNEKVKAVHVSIRNVATTLAKTPNINNDEPEVEIEDEVENNITNNQ